MTAERLNQLQDNVETAILIGGVSGDTLPVGSIIPWSSNNIPSNYLLCDGRAVNRTDYAELFSVIGGNYGVGDGSTTFNLPNLKGRVPVGKDSTQTEFAQLNTQGGEKTHTLTSNEMPEHSHTIPIDSFVNNDSQTNDLRGGHIAQSVGAGINYPSNAVGKNQPHNNLQPYIVLNFIIKAKQSAGLVATVVDNLNSTSETDALSAKQGRLLGTYSTDNEVQVGHWIDGKPIYRKVFNVGLLGNTRRDNYFNFADGIYKNIIKVDGFLYKANGSCTTQQYNSDGSYLLFHAETTSTGTLMLMVNRSSAEFWADWYVSFIVEYTKTTD